MKYNFSFIISGIEPEPSDTSFEATDLPIENSSQEQQQSQEILEDDPACSVGEPQKEIEQQGTAIHSLHNVRRYSIMSGFLF